MKSLPLAVASIVIAAVAGCSRDDVASSTTITSAATDTRRAEPVARPASTLAVSPAVADQRLNRRVEAAVAGDPALSSAARNVEITATDGVISLRGTVDDAAAKEAIERAAAAVVGVDETLNKILISPSRDFDRAAGDETIAYSLQRALAFDQNLSSDAEHVSIEVTRGKVTLRGTTRERPTAIAAEAIAASTPGVVAVDNQLTVRP